METKNTVYRVFYAPDEEPSSLVFVGETGAINDIKAIAAVVGDEPESTLCVAIPARNLRVRTVRVVNQPKVVIG